MIMFQERTWKPIDWRDPFGPFQLQEDSISGSECKQAYGFNSRIYITVETN